MMKKNILSFVFVVICTISASAQSPEKFDYKVSEFYDGYGWMHISIVDYPNITILCYANQNEYHASGRPFYVLQGTIEEPDGVNVEMNMDADPEAGVVDFDVIYLDPDKENMVSYAIWYKYNKNGKDRLEIGAGEGTLDIEIAK